MRGRRRCGMGEITREFVGLPSPVIGRAGAGGHPCQGIYHRPAGARPTTALIATHYNVDFSEHYLASFLAERGYGFLGWNTRFRGAEAHFLLDHALAEIGVGVRWLRETAGVERVVLLGNSGGGSLMAAYQSQAVEPNVTPVAGMRPLRGDRGPACRRRVCRAGGAHRAARGADGLARPFGHGRDRPVVGRSGVRPVRPARTGRRSRSSSSGSTAARSGLGTIGSPTGRSRP